jgi:signal transduction histidine kinase
MRGFRLTLRLRLTLLYGGCFLVAGAALLGITYGLVAHDTGNQRSAFVIRGARVGALGASPTAVISDTGGSKDAHPIVLPSGAGTETIDLPSHGSDGPVRVSGGGTPNRLVTITKGGKSTKVTLVQAERIVSKQTAVLTKNAQAKVNGVVRQANVALTLQRSSSLSSLLTWSGIALAVMALVSIGLGWLVAGRALAPIRTMNTRARSITAESLHERLGLEERDDELGELATAFDELLGRLEGAFDSQKRFVANASHELRTPLTLERTLVELALADPEASRESLRQTCERVLASTEQQERLIEALLTLARSQAGVEAGSEVDLADVVGEMLMTREARLEGIKLESQLDQAIVVGDGALLERLVSNLIDNAVLHNPTHEPWIRVSTGELRGQPGLVVANSGPQIPNERVDELFEPFRRLEADRTSERDGLGLGLSIVQAIANAHGAVVTARALPEGGLEVELRFAAAVGESL